MIKVKRNILFFVAVFGAVTLITTITQAAFDPPGLSPPSGNVVAPLYSSGSQSLGGNLTVTASSGAGITVSGGSAGVLGSNTTTAIQGALTSDAGGGDVAVYGNAYNGDGSDYSGVFYGGAGVQLTTGDLWFSVQGTGISWPRESDSAALYGIKVDTDGILSLTGHGGGIVFRDQTPTVRMTLEEDGDLLTTGDVTVADGKSLKIDNGSANTTLYVGNYGDAGAFSFGTNYTVDLVVEGNIKGDGLCIEDDCRTDWSSIEGNVWTLSGATLYPNSSAYEVAIGSTSAGAKLQVNAETSQEGIRVVSASNYSPLNIRDSTNSSDIFRVDQSGVLQVGTVPWARLSGHPSVSSGAGLSGGGALSSTQTLSVDTTSISACTGSGDKVLWDSGNNRFTCGSDASGSGTLTGSGTTNYISKWSGSTSLGNSLLYDSGARIGIQDASPGYVLDVNDDGSTAIVNVDSNDATSYWSGLRVARQGSEKWFVGISNSSDNFIIRRDGSTNELTLDSSGNMTIDGTITATGGNSSNWNTAYSQREYWDGSSSGSFNAATGRTSLGLGALSVLSTIDASYITTNMISSLNSVSNDGGNIDLVAGDNITITPGVNQVTIAAASSAEVDGVIGNEVTNVTNSTLSRSGSGTGGSPYTLGLNLGNANTWTGAQTFNAQVKVDGNFILDNVSSRPTCDAGTKGNLVFDTVEDKPFVCTGAGWKPLDSDGDKDGVTDAFDADDNDANDATATTADVASGKTFYANSSRETGTASLARPGCSPGDSGTNSGDMQTDYCDNDHDGTVDEVEYLNTNAHYRYGGLLVDEPGETCYYSPGGGVLGTNGQFAMVVPDANGGDDRYCTLKHGAGWSSISSGGGNYGNTCYWSPGYGYWISAGYATAIEGITCNHSDDDNRN